MVGTRTPQKHQPYLRPVRLADVLPVQSPCVAWGQIQRRCLPSLHPPPHIPPLPLQPPQTRPHTPRLWLSGTVEISAEGEGDNDVGVNAAGAAVEGEDVVDEDASAPMLVSMLGVVAPSVFTGDMAGSVVIIVEEEGVGEGERGAMPEGDDVDFDGGDDEAGSWLPSMLLLLMVLMVLSISISPLEPCVLPWWDSRGSVVTIEGFADMDDEDENEDDGERDTDADADAAAAVVVIVVVVVVAAAVDGEADVSPERGTSFTTGSSHRCNRPSARFVANQSTSAVEKETMHTTVETTYIAEGMVADVLAKIHP
ncbi:hypothetical protein BC939DRAFT_479290 [Gamsiella multidivaricata]|uniref:uncharacterized protein n=1 Tax=Gamsiella multidivaricata TaxID=101098 RepID=UPI00221EC5B5|nr:uncharacterized protein BC939DRAFT_479290 [Gamsiella multidivaricata]KAI7819967.1 hypothetical protein BC939DRAFT_479290 [Gamsiella multidivaricata]